MKLLLREKFLNLLRNPMNWKRSDENSNNFRNCNLVLKSFTLL